MCYKVATFVNMKGKPIGVRFDMEQLEQIKKDRGLKTPQSVVNFFFDSYFGKYDKPVKMNYDNDVKKIDPNHGDRFAPVKLQIGAAYYDIKGKATGGVLIDVPDVKKFRPKMEGEECIYYNIAKAIWEQKQKEDLTKLL